MKTEHKELAAELVRRAEEKTRCADSILECYEAVSDAIWELSWAMRDQYKLDELPAVAGLFDDVLGAANGVCGTCGGELWTATDDEYLETQTWADATFGEIRTENCNHRAFQSHRYETFAADVIDAIMRCFEDDGVPFSDEQMDIDGEMQFFRFYK